MSSTQNQVREFTDPPSSLSSVVRPKSLFTSSSWPSASPHPLPNLHQYTNLSRTQAIRIISTNPSSPSSSSSEEVSYRWHLPDPGNQGESGRLDCPTIRSQTVVVLLGWLGAKQKHLKKYADWYTSRGFHVVTFTLPMADILSYKDHGKNLIFHTFSNTGWMMYGVILENFQKQDPSLMDKIKCCVVDSAPVAAPDPQVWASGFSAAILKKQSSSSKATAAPGKSRPSTILVPGRSRSAGDLGEGLQGRSESSSREQVNRPPTTFFGSNSSRLADVFEVLSSRQPRCPQLYVYSSSDRVIPASSVESFMEAQKKAGHEVRAHNFVSSPTLTTSGPTLPLHLSPHRLPR
ncbi:unnamed protein product [Spirodela intermedia]|uniref:Uncharacterized protein n=1 Tax=Spirodela intermedia TaxID=51605 RepID=A0A7I8JUG4_SPIIN|nr:unnamed protein product [Spirodela intermedia]CAA6673395.1 unnamed protein product [Spirodela intermedia]